MIWKFITALARKLDPEIAHRISLLAFKLGIHPRFNNIKIPTTVSSLNFINPIGLAAGFDKNAEAIKSLHYLNFGFCEVGTITPIPQYGNPKPRVFRLSDDKAIINRNGFNNIGMVAAKKNLIKYRNLFPVGNSFIVGVNIGPNKDSYNRVNDYRILSKELSALADYISINISSPNTPNLRDFHETRSLKEVIEAVNKGIINSRSTKPQLPVFLKIAPDINITILKNIIKMASSQKIAGLIISNTTIERKACLKSKNIHEVGGLSGEPLFLTSTNLLAQAKQFIESKKFNLNLIAVGGVSDHFTAYAKILCGADLVQLYSSLTYEGPDIANKINRGIIKLMDRDKIKDLLEIKGYAKNANEALLIAKHGFS
jgi:dihydroorotate dehydrogenase